MSDLNPSFDWKRFERIQRAAMRRFERQAIANVPTRRRHSRYSKLMIFAINHLENAAFAAKTDAQRQHSSKDAI